MQLLSRRPSVSALTRIELLGTIGAATLFVLLIVGNLTAGGKPGEKAKRIRCVNNLKNLNLSLRMFAPDESQRITNLWATVLSLTNEISTPRIFVCPSDTREWTESWPRLQTTNVSYFLDSELFSSKAPPVIAGDRNLSTRKGAVGGRLDVGLNDSLIPQFDASMHSARGHLAIADGSVQAVENKGFSNFLSAHAITNATWLLPMDEATKSRGAE